MIGTILSEDRNMEDSELDERVLEVRRDDRDRRRIKEKTGNEIDPKTINSRERN